MESQDENTSQYQIKRKLLIRDIHLDDRTPRLSAYTKLKRIYLRDINQKSYSSKKVKNLQEKQLVCLKTAKLDSKTKSRNLNFVKKCKNLKRVTLDASGIYCFPVKLIIPIIKRLPKSIETITVSTLDLNGNVAELHTFYKSLGTFRNLRFYDNDIMSPNKEQSHCLVLQGYGFIRRYLSQLPKLKEIHCNQEEESQEGFLNYILQDEPCYFMTGLKLRLSENNDNDDYIEYDEYEDQDQNQDQETDMNDKDAIGNENEERISKIEPLLRFRLFPNLRKLELLLCYVNLDPIQSFLIEGFKDLKSLEYLFINFEDSWGDYGHLYTALLQLPLLKSFTTFAALKQNEGKLLAEFLAKQTQLINLDVRTQTRDNTKSEYKVQRECFENICLENKSTLRYLKLDTQALTIESLSKSLQKWNVIDQLEELSIQVFDDFEQTSLSPVARVEGLCNFIKRQKHSLKHLEVTLSLVIEDEILDNLIHAFGDLEELRHFSFRVNSDYHIRKYYRNHLKNIEPERLKGSPSFKKTFSPLSQTLQKLGKLSYLHLELNPMAPSDEKSTMNSSVIFNALPRMYHLKDLNLCLPCLRESIDAHPNQISLLSTLKGLNSVQITDPEKGEIKEISKRWLQTRFLGI